jgi:Tat protein translocase TatB subunit
MGGLGFSEMLFLFVLALLVFGPKRLPEIGRQIGKALAEFRRASNEFKHQLESEMRQMEIEEELRKHPEGAPGKPDLGLPASEPAILPPPEPQAMPDSVNHEAGFPAPAEAWEEQHVSRSDDNHEIGGTRRS